jgi:STE24 endopeptidase
MAWGAGLLLALTAPPLSVRLRGLAEDAAGPVPAPLGPTATVLAFVTLLCAAHQFGALPIDFFHSFVLEHRYGLSTERFRHWVFDRLKAAALGVLLTFAAAACLYLAVRHFPGWWWAVVAAGYAVVVVALTGLAPVVLLPIFFTFRPVERQELRDRLIALSRRAGVAVSDACEWRVSDRTKKANAALTGLGRTRRIIVSDTLLSRYSDDEVEGILAHELGHLVRHDIWRGMALHTLVTALGLLVASRVLAALASPLGWTGAGDVAGLPALLLAIGAVSTALRPSANAFSRRMERAADRFAIDLTGNPEAFASAIERLGTQNLTEERPSRLARWFFYTHPPVAERIAAARAQVRAAQG